jgi:vacuolar-type H+-ATPase subunit H
MKTNEKKSDALDALARIREAEEKTKAIIRKAKEETSLKIIQDAQDEVKQIKEKAVIAAREKAKKIKETTLKRAEEEASRIREETKKSADTLRQKGKTMLPEAVDKVALKISKFLEGGAV